MNETWIVGRVSGSVTRHHEYDAMKGCGGLRLRLIHPTSWYLLIETDLDLAAFASLFRSSVLQRRMMVFISAYNGRGF
jgi:hypothetical protein